MVKQSFYDESLLKHFTKGLELAKEIGNEQLVYDAYQKLLGPDAKELLEQAGCDDAAYPWSDAPVETIEAIVEVVQLPDEP